MLIRLYFAEIANLRKEIDLGRVFFFFLRNFQSNFKLKFASRFSYPDKKFNFSQNIYSSIVKNS